MGDIQFNKKDAYIIGAGGFGRELETWLNQQRNKQTKYEIKGYLDKNINAITGNRKLKVVNVLDKEAIIAHPNVYLAIAQNSVKERITLDLESWNANILSFFDQSSCLGDSNQFGKGAIIFPQSVVSCDCTIGSGFFLNCGSQIGHDCIIGDFVSIMANVDIGGGAKIADKVFIGSNATILPGVSIPANTIIGAGAIVTKSLKQPGSYFGNPAKRIF